MKKFLLCIMLAGLMMPVVAQEKMTSKMAISHISEGTDLGISQQTMLPMAPTGTLVEVDGWKFAGTSEGYDRQTQCSVYPMTQLHDDGFIGCTWTNEDNPPFEGNAVSNLKRGVAYTFSWDGGITWNEVDLRVGGIPLYWPSYAQWGPKGEAILARSADTYEHEGMQILNGLVLLTREKKGVGEWKLTVMPYPEGASEASGHVMAWARMTTSGENHQYIHIMSPMSTPGDAGTNPFMGYDTPVFYYRTQDGGDTWDIEGKLVPEMVGQEWHSHSAFNDAISFAVQGDIVACSFVRFGSLENYVMKSLDNGETWTSIAFHHSTVGYYGDTAESTDTCYSPTLGCIALDMNGKIHIAFGLVEITNNEQEGYLSYYYYYYASFLSYWNEDMDPIDGNVEFSREKMSDIIENQYFDFDLSDEQLYVKTTVPQLPIVGFYTPIDDENLYTIDVDVFSDWASKSYRIAGLFSFPQIAVDLENKVHIVYLGAKDNGQDDNRWFRHPYYVVRDANGDWSETEYLVNTVDLIDREFAYLTLAGIGNDKMYLMSQVDPYAGVHIPYSSDVADHPSSINYYYFFTISGVPSPEFVGINEVNYTPLAMSVIPNPASGQATVNFEGKGNVTVYNMLGQAVYHVENVENMKTISLNNMTPGVYFVTVRSGNATATQKLIVQ